MTQSGYSLLGLAASHCCGAAVVAASGSRRSRLQPLRPLLNAAFVAAIAASLGCQTEALDAAIASPPETTQLRGRTMGTTYSIRFVRDDEAIPSDDELQAAIDAVLETVNDQMSTYRADSELSRFNRAPADAWFDVSPATTLVVGQALEFHKATGGALDVTVGPLLRVWGFGPAGVKIGDVVASPEESKLRQATKLIGADKLTVRSDPPALKKSIAGLEVDLSAIAKGYGVDAVVEELKRCGVANCMVEIGGELRTAGTRADGDPWRIGIEDPLPGTRQWTRTAPLSDLAMATSGDYRNYRTAEGERVAHVIDPRTLAPLPFRGASVTVIATTCLEADALATALLVLGPDVGYDWCVEHDIAALYQAHDAQTQRRATPQFSALTAQE